MTSAPGSGARPSLPRVSSVQSFLRSGPWTALVAMALLEAASRSMGLVPSLRLRAVVGLGTLGVYGFDRWAVRRRGRPWWVLPALGAAFAGLALPADGVAILAAVCVLALVHARLRELPWAKPLYIALAWIAVVVGLPWVLAGEGPVPGVALPVALAIVANVLGCDAIDREAEAARLRPVLVWWIARAVALAGVVVAWPAPGTAIPATLLLALLPWPASRRWAELGLDGALLVGAVVTVVRLSG